MQSHTKKQQFTLTQIVGPFTQKPFIKIEPKIL